jgi:excisionase family DNA binding protein
LTGITDQAAEGCAISPIVPPQTDSEDPWLKHPEAAEYLGISRSTLYRYACQRTIESRKLGGRLEYHRSTLDRFKNRQIRPARRIVDQGSIITRALGSGK